jgi:hypothetical protein
MSNKIIITKAIINNWEMELNKILHFRIDIKVSNNKTAKNLLQKLMGFKGYFKITLENLESLQKSNQNFLSKSDKKKFKIINNLSRAKGLAKGTILGIENFEDYNKEGLVKLLNEISELITKSLQEIENQK